MSSKGYQEQRLARTKIVATVGPASATREMLAELVLAGVDVFRLNFAHGSHDWLSEIVRTIRDISREHRRPIGILGDLSGPKIRLGMLPGDSVACAEGAEFTFIRGMETSNPKELTCTYEPLIDDVRPGDRILLADGCVAMRVLEYDPNQDVARCVVEVAGTIRSRQGVNLPGVALSTPSLTDKDRSDLAWAVKEGIDFVGLSFVRRVADVVQLREAIAELDLKSKLQIVSKIEKPEALDELEAIVDASDAMMVARGDLGVEVDIVQVPGIQKRLIHLCNQKRKPVITATQMLDSMQRNELPTRAEASDVYNAVLDGTDAVMLSGETAAGLYPRQAVAMMSRIAHEAEQHRLAGGVTKQRPSSQSASHWGKADDHALPVNQAFETTEAIAIGAVATAERLHADLIAVATVSGRAAQAIAKERTAVPILAICVSPQAARSLTLLWGVTPIEATTSEHSAASIVEQAEAWGLRESVLTTGSRMVVMASSKWSSAGHDSMLVHTVGQCSIAGGKD